MVCFFALCESARAAYKVYQHFSNELNCLGYPVEIRGLPSGTDPLLLLPLQFSRHRGDALRSFNVSLLNGNTVVLEPS